MTVLHYHLILNYNVT